MNADSIKNALMRKIGPFPAWVWLGVGGIALFIYRQRMGASASTADQAQTAAADSAADYGPYGQDNYPIDGGAGTGGGSSGAATSTPTSPAAPPTINVTVPGAPATANPKRTPKPKAQHAGTQKNAAGKITGKVNKAGVKTTMANPRSAATVHNGRQHPKASGKARTKTRSRVVAKKPPPKKARRVTKGH